MGPDTVQAMLEVIRHESIPEKMKAATALGRARVATPEAVSGLREMLLLDYPPARASAVYALGRSRAGGVGAVLAAMLQDPDATVRIEVCRALLELNAVEYSIALPFADASVRVRQAAFAAAVGIGRGRVEQMLAERYAVEPAAALRAQILKTLNLLEAPQAVRLLPPALSDKDIEVRVNALDYIAAQGNLEWRYLQAGVAAALQDSGALVRRAAVSAAGRIHGENVEGVAVKLLADADHTVRRRAAEVLGEHAVSESARTALSGLAGDPVREVRRAGSAALLECLRRDASLRPEITQRALAAVNAATSPERREGLWLLGTLESSAGFPGIMRFGISGGEDISEAVRNSADGRIMETRLLAWIVRQTAHYPAAELMIEYFVQPFDQYLRIHAARAIGVMRYEAAVPVLVRELTKIEILEGQKFFAYTGEARRIGIWALGEIGGEEAMKGLAKIAGTIDPQETDDNLRDISEILLRYDYKGAVKALRRALGKGQHSEQGEYLRARTIAILEGREEPPPPAPAPPSYSRFFLNAD